MKPCGFGSTRFLTLEIKTMRYFNYEQSFCQEKSLKSGDGCRFPYFCGCVSVFGINSLYSTWTLKNTLCVHNGHLKYFMCPHLPLLTTFLTSFTTFLTSFTTFLTTLGARCLLASPGGRKFPHQTLLDFLQTLPNLTNFFTLAKNATHRAKNVIPEFFGSGAEFLGYRVQKQKMPCKKCSARVGTLKKLLCVHYPKSGESLSKNWIVIGLGNLFVQFGEKIGACPLVFLLT